MRLFGLVLLLLLPAAASAGTYTDSFSDGVVTPPWTEVEGTNSESAGQFHTTGMSGATHVGPVITQVVPQAVGESHLFFSGTVTSNDGGSGFVLKQNGTDRCGAYIWSNGAVWLTGDSPTESNAGPALIGPAANSPTLLEMELDGTLLTIFIYGVQVWQGQAPQCNFTTDGTVGINLHTGRTAHWDDFSVSWYEADGDGDGYCPGDFCSGTGVLPGDCDDADPANFPTNPEICDGQDNNCDTLADDADPLVTGRPTWHTDADSDLFGDPATAVAACAQPAATIADGTDCDDTDPAVNPAAAEVCDGVDTDCSGVADDVPDGDGDTVGACFGDCDDADPTAFPGAPELCDGIDNDCDGAPLVSEVDADGDLQLVCAGYCDDSDPAVFIGATETCSGVDDDCDGATLPGETDADGDGVLVCAGDCDDFDPAVLPGAAEVCNGGDDDCDGATGLGEVDVDLDGTLLCDGDCDDADPLVSPERPEVCNEIDDDCDGLVDDDDEPVAGQSTWYVDADEDGFGDEATAALACRQPQGSVAVAGDCDDGATAVHPGAEEVCNGRDDDCDEVLADGEVDEDLDGVLVCEGDCDDDDPAVHPDALEVCGNEIDDDCDTLVDEDFDADGDGFRSCDEDCDDDNAAIFPEAEELCDGLDGDCDGEVPEVEIDADEDGWSPCDGDCDDTTASVAPDAIETCEGTADANCDGIPGEAYEHCDDGGPDCGCAAAEADDAPAWALLLPPLAARRRRADR